MIRNSEIYNSAEAGRVLAISKAKIQRFVTDGLVVPFKDSSGPGTARMYSGRNLAELMLVGLLFKRGLTTPSIRAAMAALRESYKKLDRQAGEKGAGYSFFDPSCCLSIGFRGYLVSVNRDIAIGSNDYVVADDQWFVHTQPLSKKEFSVAIEQMGVLPVVVDLTNIAEMVQALTVTAF